MYSLSVSSLPYRRQRNNHRAQKALPRGGNSASAPLYTRARIYCALALHETHTCDTAILRLVSNPHVDVVGTDAPYPQSALLLLGPACENTSPKGLRRLPYNPSGGTSYKNNVVIALPPSSGFKPHTRSILFPCSCAWRSVESFLGWTP